MTSHQYEVALFAEFFSKDLQPILNRITLHCDSAEPMHSREVVFEPIDVHGHRDQAILRARKEFIVNGKQVDAPWHLYSYLKPESARVHPEATVRPWATVQVEGDATGFAAALGYCRRSQIYKRGYCFRKGSLIILMFQQEQVDPKSQQPIPAHADTLWEVEVKTAEPICNTPETPLSAAIEQVLDIQLLMKGLLDLRRQDL